MQKPARQYQRRCLCGHQLHLGGACGTCGCQKAAPDYVADAEASGVIEHAADPDDYRRLLRVWQEQVAASLGYVPMGSGNTQVRNRRTRRCAYCGQAFQAPRSHARTCSGACRQARSQALRLDCDADVMPASCRRETYSDERARATGYGLLTEAQCYAADLRVRRAHRRDQRKSVRRAARRSA